MWSFELVALVPATVVAIWVAWSDLSSMKIPNKAVLALLAIFVVLGLAAFPLPEFGMRLLSFAVVLGIGFLMTITGLVGAGDAKFAAAMAPFVALSNATNVAIMLAIATVVSFVSHRLLRASPVRKLVPHWASWERKQDFPMGLPLAITLIWYLAREVLR